MPIAMVRLVCIDVDGTLVGSSGSVHEAVWPAAAALREAGVRLAIASGRPAFGVARAHAQRLMPDGWHIFQSGASLVHLGTGASRSAPIEPACVQRLIARAREVGRDLELYADLEYAIESHSARAQAHAALLGVPFAPRALESLTAPVVRAQWMVAHHEVESLRAELDPELTLSSAGSPVMPDTAFVSLTRKGIDKASAVRTVAEAYGVALAEVMFVGDGDNDLGALRIVGVPVAMGNAEAAVKAVATHHVGHVDEGGLAEALRLATFAD